MGTPATVTGHTQIRAQRCMGAARKIDLLRHLHCNIYLFMGYRYVKCNAAEVFPGLVAALRQG